MTERRKDLVEFEARLREMKSDPAAQLFLHLVQGMSPAARDAALEQQMKLMGVSEKLGSMLGNILRSEEGSQRLREIAKKSPGDKS